MSEKVWTEKQRNVQYALATGNLDKVTISKQFDVSRQTIYNWLNNPEFVCEVDKLRQELRNFGEQLWYNHYQKSIENIIELADRSPDQRVKFNANIYNIERIDGKIANQVNVNSDQQERKIVNGDILEQEQEKWEQQMIEQMNNEE
ncbi:IS630 transposase-related protein [Cytobacillus kochii]|uniref:phBC6A51 family helix-turn-helix protein n=1 Tax=Cytobacillus kochii TaxID=859143 RepID=UPI001CD19B8C|nr:phBC6A51 family helix-turn-helix protein [Cytobacillus kochii]MCA1027334.1 IS630 transposase-related protein [Cytobacillus kochii]